MAGVSDSGGYFRIDTTTPYDVLLAVGDRVYLDGIGVASVTALVDADTFDIDAAYDPGIIPSFVNQIDTYPDYYMSVRVTKLDTISGIYKQVSEVRIEPDYTGLAKFDLSSIARATVKATATQIVIETIPATDDTIEQHAILKVGVAEYTLSMYPFIVVSSPEVLHAAMPVRSRIYGGTIPVWLNTGANMARYYPAPSGEDKSQFLTSVRKLRMWHGLPFCIGFFMNADIPDINIVEVVKDVTGTTIGADAYLSSFGPFSRNYLGYYSPSKNCPGYGGYDPTARLSEVSITSGDSTILYTEVLPIRHTSCLPKSPVYLRALDTVGTWRYFCFGARAEYGITTRSGETFEQWVENIAFKTDTGRLLTKSATPTIKIGAELLDEWDRQICEVIIASPEVQMLANPLTWNVFDPLNITYETPDWRTVIVKDGNFQTKTTPTLSTVEMTIELPDIQLQSQ